MCSYALQTCGVLAKNMYKNQKLVSLDIKNAFNSLPFNAIENTLERLALPKNISDYIILMLKCRYSAKTG